MTKVAVRVPLPTIEVTVDVDEPDNLTEINEKVQDKIYGNDMDWIRVQENIGDKIRYWQASEEDIVDVKD